jgi:hypothetical protein
MFYNFGDPNFTFQYDIKTGLPPQWIMKESEGFFVAKITSLFSFITGNCYLAITLIFGAIAANVSWRFFVLMNELFKFKSKLAIYACLFLPSLSFWCSGITKDTLVLISIFSILVHFFYLLKKIDNRRFYHIFIMIFHFWMLSSLRPVLLMAVIIPLLIAISARFTSRIKSVLFKRFFQIFISVGSTLILVIGLQIYGNEKGIEDYIKEAEVVQQDFTHNKLYTGKKYTIEVTDYSPTGLLKVLPQSVVAGIYRPFIWEALSPSLILNGIESIFFIYLTFKFFIKDFFVKIKFIRRNEFFVFCFLFVIIFAFLTGFTSILFGVLVRLRAPLLPFLGILLIVPALLKDQNDLEAENIK